jgi:cyclase
MTAANLRIIARLDVKGPNLIKGIHLEGLRVIGEPSEFAEQYYQHGIDEILYMDPVASLYGRNHLEHVIEKAAENIFVPLTVGGGIRTVEDAKTLLRAGADKVAVNTAAIENPKLISELSNKFGSQAVVLSIEAKQIADGNWEAMTHCGRERTGRNVIQWIEQAEKLGVGEILVTSIDKEGTKNGFDIELMKEVSSNCSVPVIASGGMGNSDHLIDLARETLVDGIGIASVLHYKIESVHQIRKNCISAGLNVRHYG